MKSKIILLAVAMTAILTMSSCEREARISVTVDASPSQWEKMQKNFQSINP